jgi:hypothetical protein
MLTYVIRGGHIRRARCHVCLVCRDAPALSLMEPLLKHEVVHAYAMIPVPMASSDVMKV